VLQLAHTAAPTVIIVLLVNNVAVLEDVHQLLVNAVVMEDIVNKEISASSSTIYPMMYAAQTCNVLRTYLVDKRFVKPLPLRLELPRHQSLQLLPVSQALLQLVA
jgi:hypothetical protein